MAEAIGGWTQTTPSTRHEFERTVDGVVFRAYRNRTSYGWSWWTVTRDGAHYRDGGDLFGMVLFVPAAAQQEAR